MIKIDKYPVFKPNQVLSDGQLNKIVTYLEPQDRLTRTMTIGRGVLYGLDLKIGSDAISVHPGIGLTSAGYIIVVPEIQEYKFGVAFTPTNQYKPFLAPDSGTDHIELLKLAASDDPDDTTSVALGDLNLEDYVIAIFLNEYEFDLTTCLPENCDNQGAEQRLEWHLLLLQRTDALEVIKNADSRLGTAVDEAEVTGILHAKYELKPLTLRRPLLSPANVVKYSILSNSYRNICSSELIRFKDAIISAYKAYATLVGPLDINKVVETLYSHYRRLNDGRGLQYFWDFLDDLFHAYNEFIDRAFVFTTVSGVTTGTFSHHLFIGTGGGNGDCRPTIFRHFFAPAGEDYFYGNQAGEVEFLFQRIVKLISGFDWKPDQIPLRITPQELGHAFERRAIPHYLNRELVNGHWSLDASRRCQQDLIASYHREDDRLLQDNQVDANHFLIGGHMYRKKEAVLEELEKLRTNYNLPFRIKMLELGAVPEFSSGGCNLGYLRILYEINRLDVLCFVEDKIRFLNSIVADDLEFETEEEEKQERELERKPTDIEITKKLDFSEVIDFGRNRVFTIQRRKAQKQGALSLLMRTTEAAPEALDMTATAVPIEQPATFSSRSVVYEPTNTTLPYKGRKQSRYEKEFDEIELEKIKVPSGIKELVERKPSTKRVIKEEPFEKQLAPKAEAVKKEIPIEEDSTSFTIKARDIAFAFPKTPVTDYIKYRKDELGDRLLSEIVGNLVKLLEELPEEVHLFDTEAMQRIYAVIKDKALALKDIVEELLGSQDYAPKGVEYALIAELLELVDSCFDMRLGKIVELHNNEWHAAENADILADYIDKHPALHHCGGVHSGGTHVLVSGYIDKVREITRIKELTRPLFIRAPLAVYKELRGNVYENVLRTAGHFNRKAFTWSKRIDKERIESRIKTKAVLAPAISLDRTRSALLDGLLRTIESTSDEELILFDFCHSYICCSECSSIEYVVIAELKLYLPKLAFCIDDSNNYAFGIYPPGGIVKGSGVKKIGETFYFTPSESSVGEQLFSYEFGGREIQLVANVMARPQARFAYTIMEFVANEDGIATAAIVQFTNLSVDADNYYWEFGDGITSEDDSPKHTFNLTEGNTFQVTLTATVEACKDKTEQELSLVPIEFYIEQHIEEFCNADTNIYNLIAEPVEGGVFGENDAIDAAARTFHPDRVNLGGQISARVELSYQLEQQEATLAVEVYARPQPSFSVEILESGAQSIIVRFINGTVNGDKYTWDFGDGNSSSSKDPTHEYQIATVSDFTVVLTAGNGPCQESFQQVLTLTPLVLQFGAESDGLFCDNDDTGILLVGSPADGTYSGSGVQGDRFIPALVNMGNLHKKTVTLSYTLGARTAALLATIYKYPVLGFEYKVAPATLGVLVSFKNTSVNAEKYVWDLGDGTQKTGITISHNYQREGIYDVTLTGINPPCQESLTKTVAARIEEPQTPEIVPTLPLKTLNEMLESSSVRSLLKQFEADTDMIADFYRQMSAVVFSGDTAVITEYAEDMLPFMQMVTAIAKIGEQMHSRGLGQPDTQKGQLIGVYRLTIGNIMNVLSQRKTDIPDQKLEFRILESLINQAAELGPHLRFDRFLTKGFELVPTSWFDDLPVLQKLHKRFGEVL